MCPRLAAPWQARYAARRMIVVLGRPLAARPPFMGAPATVVPGGLCVAIARAAVAAGASVELVGSIVDDAAGDAVVLELARAGVGHAALLRAPASRAPDGDGGDGSPLPPLDEGDVQLGLDYLLEFTVLLLAEQLGPAAEAVAVDAAVFRGAQVVAVVPHGASPSDRLAGVATVLEAPDEDGGAFAWMIGRFAAELDRGAAPADGFTRAAAATGWERRP